MYQYKCYLWEHSRARTASSVSLGPSEAKLARINRLRRLLSLVELVVNLVLTSSPSKEDMAIALASAKIFTPILFIVAWAYYSHSIKQQVK
jgi:hypothetical protein